MYGGGSMRAWLSVALVVACLGWTLSAAVTDPGDVKVLLKLKKAWGGGLSLWSGLDPCYDGWLGVFCDDKNTRVTSLYLISADLAGTIPPEIGSLSALVNLDLSFNTNLKGQLPSELGSLTNLLYLSLQKCSFSGRIPESLGKLEKLTFLALNNNGFSGELPSALGALSKLKWFDVAYNKLEGSLPVSTSSKDSLGLDTWPDIEHYHLNDNQFSGIIPPELGNAAKCLHMLLEANSFTGPIPESFGNLSSLQILSLHYNQLAGPIPSTLSKIIKFGKYAGLHQIRVSNNQLSGTLPNLNALNQLEYVDFSNNLFDPQPFPKWLNESSEELQTIKCENCSWVGPLPADILAYPSLQGLYLQHNRLNGSLTIPVNLGKKLQYVSLQNNGISVVNPQNPNAELPQIQLEDNPICSGEGLLRAGPTLCSTEANSNGANEILTWISSLTTNNSCPSLCRNANHVLNPYTCHCGYPLVVTLEIRAPISSIVNDTSLWDLLKAQTYDSLRNLTSQIKPPLELDSEQLWVYQAQHANHSKVHVRLYIFAPVGAEVMDRRTDNLIKGWFTTQKVEYTSPFKPEFVIDIEPSQEAGSVTFGVSKLAIIGIATGAGALLALLGFLVSVALRQKRRFEEERKNNPFGAWAKAEDGNAPQLKGARWFTFNDMRRMTNDFDDDNMLGAGGYGKVYKGVMAETGVILAVKRAQEGSKQGADEFKNEIELLSRVHHNNLVGLVGFCYDKAEQMLVYEFVPNGSLTDWLRGLKSNQPLDWDRRLLIALGAARGLTYLHENAEPPIIHRDVKSCNILLDMSMNAKVADFGLSVMVSSVNDNKRDETIRGTMGYLDPEYYATNIMSSKSDVYSFGVVLLEIFTGRPPVSREGHIVTEFRKIIAKSGVTGVFELLDLVLVGTPVHDLDTFLKIALECVEDTPTERPSMYEVVKQLEALIGPKSLLSSGGEDPFIAQMAKAKKPRVPLQIFSSALEDFRPTSERRLQPSASSHRSSSSFKYSGRFNPSPR
uniref:non-specific serine/threonine protein kinase n=1 Tax=Physcomitrium patens TaxID=3218 RepID=A0A7I4BQM7_PHYPA